MHRMGACKSINCLSFQFFFLLLSGEEKKRRERKRSRAGKKKEARGRGKRAAILGEYGSSLV